jgi:8-oxo-dGTP diphosphatase
MDREKVVTAAISRKQGRVLIARRGPGEKLAGFWEFPGGKVEVGETAEDSLARELFEELGIVARIGEIVGESSYQYEHGSFRLIAFMVDNIEGELRSKVHDRLEWAKIDDLTSYGLLPADVPIAETLKRLTNDHGIF